MNTYTFLQKSRDAQTKTTYKYFLNTCQENITKGDLSTKDWLVIKNVILDKKVIKAMKNKEEVVVKIGQESHIKKDYWLSKYLYNNGYEGFVKYICTFECNDDIKKYKLEDQHEDLGSNKSFCIKDNALPMIYSLVMPYFSMGSIKNYKYGWNIYNFNKLKNYLKKAVIYYIKAADGIGLIHNDFHIDNIMIMTNNDIVIIDLELAELYHYTSKKKSLEKIIARDLRKLFTSLDYLTLNIDTTKVQKKLNEISDNFNETNMNSLFDILKLIDDMNIII